MRSDPIIPQRDSPVVPLDADLNILGEGYVLHALYQPPKSPRKVIFGIKGQKNQP